MKSSTHTAHQGIHARVCHILLDQSVEISSYMEQQIPPQTKIRSDEIQLMSLIHTGQITRMLLYNKAAEERHNYVKGNKEPRAQSRCQCLSLSGSVHV